MRSFTPTPAPPGRLARLGVVLDTRNTPDRLREIARMCDRAGIDALWVRDHDAAGCPRLEAWTALVLAAADTSRVRVGAMLDIALRPAPMVAAMARTLDAALPGRLEMGFAGDSGHPDGPFPRVESPDAAVRARQLKDYLGVVRPLLAEESAGVAARDAPEAAAAPALPAGPPLCIEAREPAGFAVAARVADNVLLPAMPLADIRAAIDLVRRECDRADRDPASLGIGVELPVSIGRTAAEARARAEAEDLFATIGHPAAVGIFGTLEQGQDRVIELAHLGITDLRCVLPNAADVHDVIAQLTAMVVGTPRALGPNAPRSPAPGPPPGWGGRRPGR